LIIIAGIALLLVGQGWLIAHWPGAGGEPAAERPPLLDAAFDPREEDFVELVSAETLKKYAQDFYLNTEFLNLLFPDKIVYKRAGVIYYADIDPDLQKNGYDWGRLTRSASRPVYADEAAGIRSMFGIDVSFYQEDIDWDAVAGDGVEFVMIRAGYRGYGSGALVRDERFDEYIAGAARAGLNIGIYFFSQAMDPAEAVEEADFVLEAIAGHNVTFPIVYDFEEIAGVNSRAAYLGKTQVTDNAIAFCERVAAAGYTPMVYANPGWFIHEMEMPRLENYDKWIAQYYDAPFFPYKFSLWQYSDAGKIAGIRGDVDMNLAFVAAE
jgi:GH25 family lysozyme M1 (1,4-beta-N-acetylmuramidase)